MKSQKKFIRRLLIFMLSIVFFSTIYNHFGIFPGSTRLWAIEKVDALTHKKVFFTKALYLPFHGFIFYDVQISEPDNRPIFSAKRLAMDPKIMPFLTDKKIVIDQIYLDTPIYETVLSPKKTSSTNPITHSSDIAKQITTNSFDSFLPENVYLRQIRIIDGSVTVKKTDGTVFEALRSIHLRVSFLHPPLVDIDGSFFLGNDRYASIEYKGVWDLDRDSYQFFVTASSESVPGWLLDFQQGHFLVLRDGRLSIKTRLKSVDKNRVYFHTAADIKDANISIREGVYQGALKLDTKGVFDFSKRFFERYRGHLDLSEVHIFNLSSKVSEVHNVSGAVDFQPDLFIVRNLKGQFKDIPFEARGSIRSFKDPLLDGEIFSRTSLDRVLSLLPDSQLSLLKKYNLSGDCDAVTTIHGSIKKSARLKTQYKMILRNGQLRGPDDQWIASHIKGEINSNDEGLRVSKGQFTFNDKNYDLSLLFPKIAGKKGSLHLSTQGMDLRTSYLLKQDSITLSESSISLPGITARFDGTIPSLKKPVADIQGTLRADLAPATAHFGKGDAWIKTWKPEGLATGSFTLKGPWSSFKDCFFSYAGEVSPLTLQSTYQMSRVNCQLNYSDHKLSVPLFKSDFYGGSLGGRFYADLSEPRGPFDFKIYANSVNLHLLAGPLKDLDKRLAGTLVFQSTLRGRLGKPETFTGEGSLSVNHGFLFETKEFRSMGQLPLVRVEGLESVIFKTMSASFSINTLRLWTDDLLLLSDTVNLHLSGSMGFATDLDMSMSIGYSSSVLQGAEDVGGLAPLMVQQAGDFISEYRVSGTLKQPKYSKSAMGVARNAGKKITNLLKKLI